MGSFSVGVAPHFWNMWLREEKVGVGRPNIRRSAMIAQTSVFAVVAEIERQPIAFARLGTRPILATKKPVRMSSVASPSKNASSWYFASLINSKNLPTADR